MCEFSLQASRLKNSIMSVRLKILPRVVSVYGNPLAIHVCRTTYVASNALNRSSSSMRCFQPRRSLKSVLS